MVARPRRKLHTAQLSHLAADRRVIHRYLELVADPLRQIDQSPADDPMDRYIRPAIHDWCQGLALGIIELGLVSKRLAVEKAIGTARIKAHNPVAHDLPADRTKQRCRTSAAAILNLRQCQEAPTLVRVSRNASKLPQPRRVKIAPKRNPRPRDNVLPEHIAVDLHFFALGNPPRVRVNAGGYQLP